MAPLSSLPADVLVEVLLRSSSLQDLRCTILASRTFYQAFIERRALIIQRVFRQQLEAALTRESILAYLESVTKRIAAGNAADVATIYEAGWPLLTSPNPNPTFIKWASILSQSYDRADDGTRTRKLALLETVYASVASTKPNFQLATARDHVAAPAGTHRPYHTALSLCHELCREYKAQHRISDVLAVQQSVLERIPLKDIDSCIWGADLVKTRRAVHSFDENIGFEKHMYQLCRASKAGDASLDWARHVVTEYSLAGHTDDAIQHQQAFLTDLRPGTAHHVAWARRLVTMQKRAGLVADALVTKDTVWRQMSLKDNCYYSWARELAYDYRSAYRPDEALAVIQTMSQETLMQLSGRPKDVSLKGHARHSLRALADEYKRGSNWDEARAVEQIVI